MKRKQYVELKAGTPAKAKPSIGIPKGMMYHEHGDLWKDFFEEIGCEVVLSQDTNKQVLESGVSRSSNETCLPVKVMMGHALDLAGKADYIFVPRYLSTDILEPSCPKFCALPDLARFALEGKTPVLEIVVELDKKQRRTDSSLDELSAKLRLDYDTVSAIFAKAVVQKLNRELPLAKEETGENSKPFLAVLGHPYMIFDNYISMSLIEKLRSHNFSVLTPECLPLCERRAHGHPFCGRQFYGIGRSNLGSAFLFADNPNLKGIVYLTPFACGMDSVVADLIELRLKTLGKNIPFLKLTVDEHTGEAGFDTRIEAFLDMIG